MIMVDSVQQYIRFHFRVSPTLCFEDSSARAMIMFKLLTNESRAGCEVGRGMMARPF